MKKIYLVDEIVKEMLDARYETGKFKYPTYHYISGNKEMLDIIREEMLEKTEYSRALFGDLYNRLDKLPSANSQDSPEKFINGLECTLIENTNEQPIIHVTGEKAKWDGEPYPALEGYEKEIKGYNFLVLVNILR